MIRFLADENFNGRVVRGIRREYPGVDLVRAQDTVMYGSPDPQLLEWAAQEGRIVLTHDIETMVGFAYARVAAGLPMPGVIAAHHALPIGMVVNELALIIGASETHEWKNLVVFLPL